MPMTERTFRCPRNEWNRYIGFEQQGRIEVDDVTKLAYDECGAMASDDPAMHPTINFKPAAVACRASARAAVRPPVLSSLMLMYWYRPSTAAGIPRSGTIRRRTAGSGCRGRKAGHLFPAGKAVR